MAGLIFVSPGTFDSPAGLPVVPVRQVSPIPGAVVDWAADRLANGALPEWSDLLGGRTLVAASETQAPMVVDGRVVFDGENDRIDSPVPAGPPLTVVLVARMDAVANGRIFSGGTGPQFDLGINSDSSRFTFYAAGSGMSCSAYGAPDSDWHVFVIVNNGSNSSIAIDGLENIGSQSASTPDRIRIGASSSAYYKSEVRRLAILPYAANAAERAMINTQMSRQYNI